MTKIKIYTLPTCPYCIMTKKFLNDKKVEYENVDVSDNEEGVQEMINISGQMGVPVLNINGKIIIGFNKLEIEEALKNI